MKLVMDINKLSNEKIKEIIHFVGRENLTVEFTEQELYEMWEIVIGKDKVVGVRFMGIPVVIRG